MVINDSSDVLCFDLYLINIFTKSTQAQRCTDFMFKLTLYCLSVAIEDLNLNEDIGKKSTKVERCTDFMFKLKLYCLFLLLKI